MKKCLSFLVLSIIFSSCAWNAPSSEEVTYVPPPGHKISYREWISMAQHDIRLFPKFGSAVKTFRQLEADQEFLKTAIAESGTADSASKYYFLKACDYIEQEDLQTAMYRLNQAWLLNAKNPDVYRGFGRVYLQLGAYKMAIELLNEGLRLDSNDGNMLSMRKIAIRKFNRQI